MRSSTGSGTGGSGNGSESGVSSKTFQEGQVVVVELGLNLQNQDRPLLCNQSGKSANSSGGGDDQDNDHNGDGSGRAPTCNGYSTGMKSDIIYDATPVGIHSSSPANSSVSASGFVRGLQPFDASYPSAHPFCKSAGGGIMSTAAMGFPFTVAQWKELERQAMIYKYMVASVPVPADLLYSSFTTNLSPPTTFAPTSYLLGKYGNGLNLRWVGNSKDAEPGRCRRTDGKKWRCSRDVAPNQKYCERHMHRGRPRSRKPVELVHNPLSDLPATNKIKNTNPTKKTRLNDPNTQPVASSSFPAVQMSKASAFEHPVVSAANPFEDSRSLAWVEEQQWQQLVQENMNPSVFQHQFEGQPLNLNSNCVYNPKSEMGLLKRPLIDAWSMGFAGNKENYGSNKAPFSSNGGHGNAIDENMCQIHMGLGVIDSWVGSSPTSPGGPLAEVLRPGSVATATIAATDASEGYFVTPPATAVSSPSGVLQKTHASFSDSSGSSSPTYHNSKAKSDMPFHWLN